MATGFGSSPRPGGTLDNVDREARVFRFIPTPVGNAQWDLSGSMESAVHPHARGERLIDSSGPRGSAGSSPRPWGTHREQAADHRTDRFIPTPVGNADGAPRKPKT